VVAAAALLAMTSVSGLAQTPPPLPTGPYRIAGRLVNALSGEPVRKATVAALAEEDSHIVQSVLSDADGRFVMERLPAGKFPLTASKRGFRTAFYDEHDEFNSAIVTGELEDTGNLLFRLTPAAVLHGVVTADGGDPVESASVLLFERQPASPHGEPTESIRQVDATTTDDTGAYEFSNLAAGEYLIAVTASPWYAMHEPSSTARRNPTSEIEPLDVAYPVTFFDSTTDEASASPIVLAGGGREEADINLHAVPALHIKVPAPRKPGGGFVRPELRQMVFGVQIATESAGFMDALRTGSVEFSGVAPGHYELTQGEPPRVVDLDATSSQDVDPNSGTPAVSITGTLRVAGGAVLPDDVTLMLYPEAGGQPAMQSAAHKGQFRFDTVAPGVWSLSAVASTGQTLPIVSISTGGASVGGSQLTVKDRPLSVAATASLALTRVKGFDRKDGKGAAGAMIVLVPQQPSAYRALVRRDQADSDGSFSLRDVPSGQYIVIAIEDGWKLDWLRRENISRYLPGGISVTVSDRSGAIVSLSEPVPVQPR
jgi:Carboxypeptidase regulatory-like domain